MPLRLCGVVWDEHVAEEVVEHVHDDAVACELVFRGFGYRLFLDLAAFQHGLDAVCLYLVYVCIIHSHEAEALGRGELADAVAECQLWLYDHVVMLPCASACNGRADDRGVAWSVPWDERLYHPSARSPSVSDRRPRPWRT